MFKIPNCLNRIQCFLHKVVLQVPKNSSSMFHLTKRRPSIVRFFSLLPSTCLGVNVLSMDLLKWKIWNTPESKTKADKSYVKELIVCIATDMREHNLKDALTHIYEGIEICEENKYIEFLPYLYDSLITNTVQEGNKTLAEEITVRSIEKLIEIGYKDSDNEIVRLQLILARLYQSKGDSKMASIGFRNCINIQESKCNNEMNLKEIDNATIALYLHLLFWYSIFLSDENDLVESKKYMTKALEISKGNTQEPERTAIILHILAELSLRLEEFDDVVHYLADGLRLCLENLTLDCAMPLFMVKLGLIYLVKGMNETAEYWCTIAQVFAKSCQNATVENEANLCLNYLKKSKSDE